MGEWKNGSKLKVIWNDKSEFKKKRLNQVNAAIFFNYSSLKNVKYNEHKKHTIPFLPEKYMSNLLNYGSSYIILATIPLTLKKMCSY